MRTSNQEHESAIERAARERFGWERLRPGLEDAIASVVGGRDTLAVMPTGYGKSAIYQLAGVLTPGPTIVVSPLIALQNDQAASINERPEAPAAAVVNSTRSAAKNAEAWADAASGAIEFLFLAPEQLADEATIERVRHLGVTLFVVDEAHCVSAWGHDFRPDYLRLGDVIERIGHPTIVALTATGSPPVRDEIVDRLGLRDAAVLTRGFDRANLRLEVVRHEDDDRKRRAVIDQVADMRGPGIVYTATRRDTEDYAAALQERGVRAVAYHAGLAASIREEAHEGFRDGDTDVVVATTAFGMGIDKSNVRFVIHEAVPDSLDSYYQEAGRAGRDGDPATVTLHYRSEDLGLRTFFASGAPDDEALASVFTAIGEASTPQSRARLAESLDLGPASVARLVNLLQQAGAVRAVEDGYVPTSMSRKAAVAAALEAAEARNRIDVSRIAMMRAYAETRGCRRQFLLGYFGETLEQPCGNCDTCSSGSATAHASGMQNVRMREGAAVRHAEWGEGTVMSTDADRLTVFFPSEGYKVLSVEAIEEGLLRSPADAAG